MRAPALAAARRALAAGLAPWPPAEDGTKRPAPEPIPAGCDHPDCMALREKAEADGRLPYGWIHRGHSVATEQELAALYRRGLSGVGLICGTISGGLEMLEFEGRAVDEGLLEEFQAAAEAAGLGDVLAHIVGGYSERTPTGGIHLLYRCSEVGGNQKLARRPATDEELAVDPNDKTKVLIETRGQGGYTIVAPSNGKVHPTGGIWELVNGDFDTIIEITPEERSALLAFARSFDRMPSAERAADARRPRATGVGKRPGDDFNTRADWDGDVLGPHGWTPVFTRGAVTYWRRPGKEGRGWSATTNATGNDTLIVFSSSTPFEEWGGQGPAPSYSKFAAYAVLNHGGVHREALEAAARDLARQGYGDKQERDNFDWVDDGHHREQTGGSGGGTGATWDPPQPVRAHNHLPSFPVDALPGWVADEVSAVAEFTQTPGDLAGCLSLAVLAAAAGGRAVVEVRGAWREPTNLFVVVAMPPGSRKSAVFAEMSGPLASAEAHLVAESIPKIIEALTQRDIALKSAQEAKMAAARAGDDKDELLADAVAKASLAEAITVPAQPRLIADDITPEAATSLLAEQGGRLAVLSAEGGIFSILAGKYTSGFPSFEVFLKGHSGDLLRVDRKGRPPEHIPKPALTLGLAVQPDVLRSIAHMPGFRGRGLLARILYSVPTNNVGRRKVGTDPVPAEIAGTYDTNVRALVASLVEWTDPAVLTLTREAAALHLEAERAIEPRLAPEGDLGYLADWASKLIGATARIAGVLHLADHYNDGWGLPISSATMANAIRVADYFSAHAAAAFDEMGADDVTDNARAVIGWISDRESFTRRDLYAAHRARFPMAVDADPVLDLLEDLGWIRRRPDPKPGVKGGRPPSPTFDVNPYAHNAHNARNPDSEEVL